MSDSWSENIGCGLIIITLILCITIYNVLELLIKNNIIGNWQ